ncbi:hypothetical protein PM082_024517 [Marasmius tenuissimus]|nr:hypothetical protein PM082_024517 [Marasmius tenuissimus]
MSAGMLSPVRLLLLLVPLYLGVSAQDQPDSVVGSKCCDALRARLSSKVFARGTPEYDARHAMYYSLQQQELFPNCTVRPSSASDVSSIVKIAKASQCPFAVASGGHMSWKGSSNMNGGFVIDLREINQIDISVEDQTVKINAVGVGGFLLGGGIAFASVDKGFGADNVFNYEVVLADGRIVNANNATNSDLFWALKLAGSNFGIVTRFDMHTYSSPAIWGEVSVYPLTDSTESELLTNFAEYVHDEQNRKTSSLLFSTTPTGMSPCPFKPTSMRFLCQTCPLPQLLCTPRKGSTHDVVDEVIAAALASTARTHWFTFTTKVATDFFVDLHAMGDKIFEPLKDRQGLTTTMSVQSFQRATSRQQLALRSTIL